MNEDKLFDQLRDEQSDHEQYNEAQYGTYSQANDQ